MKRVICADTDERKDRIDKFVSEFLEEPMVKKYLYRNHWTSGSSTDVYPISIWQNDIEVQWNSDRRIFDNFIDKIVKNNSDLLSGGRFRKSDGSSPSQIIFFLRR